MRIFQTALLFASLLLVAPALAGEARADEKYPVKGLEVSVVPVGEGVEVTQVEPGGRGQRSGLMVGDVVLHYKHHATDRAIDRAKTLDDLIEAWLRSRPCYCHPELLIRRNKEVIAVYVRR